MEHQKSFDMDASQEPAYLSAGSPRGSPDDTHDHDFSTAAGTPAASISVAGGASSALNPRSCVTCRRRKVRCDKHMPCANCRRANIPCIFPAPGRAPRRPRPKDPNAPSKNSTEREVELMKRLHKLEGIVEELSGQIEVESGSGRHASSAGDSPASDPMKTHGMDVTSMPDTHSSPQMDSGAFGSTPPVYHGQDPLRPSPARKSTAVSREFGRLVLNEKGNRRYVSSAFWAKLTDELEQIRTESNMIDEDDSDLSEDEETPNNSPQPHPTEAHTAFIFGYRSADVDLKKLHPLASQIPFLWQVYQENVEPLVKILHVPTTDKLIRATRKSMDDLSAPNEALLFSIYYAAVTSLEDDEIKVNFGRDKSTLLSQFRFALEQSLARANFLNTADIVVLQAFVLFLILVRRHDDTRFCWTLTGLAIRIAQGLGIHRDGTNFNLSPFEIQMRRRLWWAICTLDLRSAEELGTDLTIVDRSFDTELPTNINDADIDPDTKVMPPERDGPSDCAVVIIRLQICVLARRFHALGSAMAGICPKDAASSFDERERMMVEVYNDIETKFISRFVDNVDALFWMAAMIARIIMAKMCLVIYQPLLSSSTGPELSRDIRGRLFASAMEIVEYNHILNTDDRCKQWRWLFQTYTQWHAIAFLLMEIARRPWSATVERAWESLNGTLNTRHQIELAKMANHTAVWMPLRRLFILARRHREAEIARLRADPEAARRVDFEDRLSPSEARFGPVPGTEHLQAQTRERWRKMMRPDAISPEPSLASLTQSVTMQPSAREIRRDGSRDFLSAPGATPALTSSSTPGPETVAAATGAQVDLTDAVLNGPFNPTALWSYVYQADTPSPLLQVGPGDGQTLGNIRTPRAESMASIASPVSTADAMLRQQAIALQTQQGAPNSTPLPKDGNPPPWLWSDPFTAMNMGGDGPPEQADIEMGLDEEFNWQNWTDNLNRFEMDAGVLNPQPW